MKHILLLSLLLLLLLCSTAFADSEYWCEASIYTQNPCFIMDDGHKIKIGHTPETGELSCPEEIEMRIDNPDYIGKKIRRLPCSDKRWWQLYTDWFSPSALRRGRVIASMIAWKNQTSREWLLGKIPTLRELWPMRLKIWLRRLSLNDHRLSQRRREHSYPERRDNGHHKPHRLWNPILLRLLYDGYGLYANRSGHEHLRNRPMDIL